MSDSGGYAEAYRRFAAMQPPSPAQASDEDRSTKQTILPRSLADSKTESSSHPPSPPDIVQSVPPQQTDNVDSKQSSLKLSKNSLFYQDFSVKVPPSKLSSSHPSLSVTNQVQQLQSDTAAVQLDHNQITDDTPAIFAAPNNRTAETVDQQSAATSTLQQSDITASLLIEKQPTDINAIITTESPRRIVQRRKTVVPMDPSVEFSRQLLASSAELKPMVKLERNRRNFIGQGRRSLVFIGTHNSIKCAFKCPIEGDQESQSNLTSEAFILSHISTWKKADDGGNAGHPNIIKYFGALQEAEQGPVLVLEYCQGGTLFDYLSTHQSSCGKHLWLSWCQQITSALHFLHTGGINTTSGRREAIIHNDVKPHNVLLDERMVLKLSDFDGSVLVPLDGSGDESESKLTLVTPTVRDGLARGTQDIYSLGCSFYTLLTGREPFDAIRNPSHQLHYIKRGFWESGVNQLDQSESSETVPTQPKPKPKISQLKSSETLFSFLNGDTLAQTGADVLVYNQMLSILRQMTSIEADRRPTTKEVLLQLLRLERLFAGSTAAV